MATSDPRTPRNRRIMRYRTAVLLTAAVVTGTGLLTTALCALLLPDVNWRLWAAVSLGLGALHGIIMPLAWRTNRAYLEQAGFDRW